jgi:isopentenyl-diphosphate delta-isomerase
MTTAKHAHPFLPQNDEILEVLDAKDRPFMLMPRKQALQQKLPLKIVLVVIRDQNGKIYIHQRSNSKSTYALTWTVSAAGYVNAGESFEDAALRELAEELSVTSVNLKLTASARPSPATDNSLTALFIANPARLIIRADPAEINSGMFVDKDEFEALLRDMPEFISPALKWANNVCDLFQGFNQLI